MSFADAGRAGAWPFRAVIGAAATMIVGGTVGFMWIESWGLLDALYMTVITLSTVGFQEVAPLSDGGRLFTTVLILGGVATLGFALGAFGEWVLGAPKRRLERKMHRMKNHIIVCGYGRLAQPVVTGLARHRRPVCVIEAAEEQALAASRTGVSTIHGDATSEEVLERAGVRKATVIAALLPHDGDNLSIAMTATALRPGIRVIARSEEERSRANLERAGARAEDVFSPHATAGRAVLRSLSGPKAERRLEELTNLTRGLFETGELLVTADSPLAGRTIAESAIGADHNLLVLAVRPRGDAMVVAPRAEQKVSAGDALVLLGHADTLEQLGARLGADPETAD